LNAVGKLRLKKRTTVSDISNIYFLYKILNVNFARLPCISLSEVNYMLKSFRDKSP